MNIFNVKGFLQLCGVVLIILGIFGFIGILGSTSARSIFDTVWYFDNTESILYVLIGVIAILATFLFPPMLQRYLVILAGVVAVLGGLYSFVNQDLFGMTLQVPADSVFLLVLGAWALYAVYGNAIGKAR